MGLNHVTIEVTDLEIRLDPPWRLP